MALTEQVQTLKQKVKNLDGYNPVDLAKAIAEIVDAIETIVVAVEGLLKGAAPAPEKPTKK